LRDAEGKISTALLAWYDGHARVLPWRVSPADRAVGVRPDPYRVWLSEVMLQQTTVAAVRGHFDRFTLRWSDVAALAAAEDGEVMAEWAGLGYYARARNLLACARAVVMDHGGRFPASRDGLLALPGIGAYTAAAIAAIAFDAPVGVVDGNVERVVARLYRVATALPAAKPELARLAARLTPGHRPGDYAQAMMDLGATVCTPRKPGCVLCPLAPWCQAYAAGMQAALPRRAAKPVKPTRQGTVWIARRSDGAWLLEHRPKRGLLGGMLGWPGSSWDNAGGPAPLTAEWHALGTVRHSFTHFHLDLAVLRAEVGADSTPLRGRFIAPPQFCPEGLPSLMRKAYARAAAALDRG